MSFLNCWKTNEVAGDELERSGGVQQKKAGSKPRKRSVTKVKVIDSYARPGVDYDIHESYSTPKRTSQSISQNGDRLNIKTDDELYNTLKDYKQKYDELDRAFEIKNEEIEKLKIRLEKCQAERDDYRNRLSKQAAFTLTVDNPAIADLSDPNRPLKLAEKFNEIYDNEWTDAFEELNEEKGLQGHAAVFYLLQILELIFDYCSKRARFQMAELEESIKKFTCMSELPGHLMKIYKDERKKNFKHILPLINQEIANELEGQTFSIERDTNVSTYAHTCTEICWLMNIQDPPMTLEFGEIGGKFDKNRFKPYLTSGSKVLYIVWPALLQYSNGPLVAKGIAEGKKKRLSSKQSHQIMDENDLCHSLPYSGNKSTVGTDILKADDSNELRSFEDSRNRPNANSSYYYNQTKYKNHYIYSDEKSNSDVKYSSDTKSDPSRVINIISRHGHAIEEPLTYGRWGHTRSIPDGKMRSNTLSQARPSSDIQLSRSCPPNLGTRSLTSIEGITNPYKEVMKF